LKKKKKKKKKGERKKQRLDFWKIRLYCPTLSPISGSQTNHASISTHQTPNISASALA
jgi:hypothetical protein